MYNADKPRLVQTTNCNWRMQHWHGYLYLDLAMTTLASRRRALQKPILVILSLEECPPAWRIIVPVSEIALHVWARNLFKSVIWWTWRLIFKAFLCFGGHFGWCGGPLRPPNIPRGGMGGKLHKLGGQCGVRVGLNFEAFSLVLHRLMGWM